MNFIYECKIKITDLDLEGCDKYLLFTPLIKSTCNSLY